jgi:hypothetical protein
MKRIIFRLYWLLLLVCTFSFWQCDDKSNSVTFSSHIASIIHENCTPCHRPNAPGPFSLITYNDVLKKAKTIVKVTQSRYMPPWPADATYSSFVGERLLRQEDIDMIKQWVDAGCPVGDSTKIPAPPTYAQGSMLGEPDLRIYFPDTIFLTGGNTDHFFLARVPFILHDSILQGKTYRYVRAVEFIPGNKKYAHHMNANLINFGIGQKQNVFEGENYIPTNLAEDAERLQKRMNHLNDDGSWPINFVRNVCNYLPGVSPAVYPEGIGGFEMVQTGSFFINDIHFGPAPVDTFDTGSYFNIFFTDQRPERITRDILLGSLSDKAIVTPPLVVPAGEIKTFYIRYKTIEDYSLLTINPHMHLIGKKFLAYAITPEQDTIKLIHIPNWNFRWQYFYTFKHPVKIPAGSEIVVEGTFDNTTENPNNPFNPPRVIVDRATPFESMRTTDEMLQFILTVMAYKPGDESINLTNVSLK